MPGNLYCNQCREHIGDYENAWFSDRRRDLDFCSENCYSKWKSDHNAQKWLDENYPKDGVCQIETLVPESERVKDEEYYSEYNNIGKSRKEITKINRLTKVFIINNSKFISQSSKFFLH